jgi:hypothetical protein
VAELAKEEARPPLPVEPMWSRVVGRLLDENLQPLVGVRVELHVEPDEYLCDPTYNPAPSAHPAEVGVGVAVSDARGDFEIQWPVWEGALGCIRILRDGAAPLEQDVYLDPGERAAGLPDPLVLSPGAEVVVAVEGGVADEDWRVYLLGSAGSDRFMLTSPLTELVPQALPGDLGGERAALGTRVHRVNGLPPGEYSVYLGLDGTPIEARSKIEVPSSGELAVTVARPSWSASDLVRVRLETDGTWRGREHVSGENELPYVHFRLTGDSEFQVAPMRAYNRHGWGEVVLPTGGRPVELKVGGLDIVPVGPLEFAPGEFHTLTLHGRCRLELHLRNSVTDRPIPEATVFLATDGGNCWGTVLRWAPGFSLPANGQLGDLWPRPNALHIRAPGFKPLQVDLDFYGNRSSQVLELKINPIP